MLERYSNILKTTELKYMREAGSILREAFSLLIFLSTVGQKLSRIDSDVGQLLEKKGAKATSKLLGLRHNMACCINNEVTNGAPDDRVIIAGHLVKYDMSIYYKGVFVDKAVSIVIPPIGGRNGYIASAANLCLKAGIKAAIAGSSNIELGRIIGTKAKQYGMTPSKRFRGHGIGKANHMPPIIPNDYSSDIAEEFLKEGQAIAIEPVIFFDKYYYLDHVGGSIIANTINAHVEDTIIIHKGESEVIT
jgi:methionyl aminopeptidase